MLKNYLKIALRTLARHKSYLIINVLGLSLGITCSLLIFLLVRYHLTTDTYHAKADRIYRVVTDTHYPGGKGYTSGVPFPLPEALRNDFPQLAKVAIIYGESDILVSVPNERAKVSDRYQEANAVAFTEPSYFDIFDYNWLVGNPRQALTDPNCAVITQKYAQKYFKGQNPIGQLLRLDNRMDFKITGVLQDIPDNTDLPFNVFVSYSSRKAYKPDNMDSWRSIESNTNCFVLLPPQVSATQIGKLLPAFSQKYHTEPNDVTKELHVIQPLADVHFNADYGNYRGTIRKPLVLSLALIGVFLVLTACINFINLATAQAIRRSKEVGIRKVLGSTQMQLFWQFISETAFITVLALGLSVLLAQLLLTTPAVEPLLAAPLTLHPTTDPWLALFLVLVTLVVVFLSGSYPALVLAGFRPALALKGKITTRNAGGMSLRRGLVIVQFAISQALIIGMIIVARQMDYFRQTDLGFRKEAIVMVPIPNQDKGRMETMRQRLQSIPGVEQISFSLSAPSSQSNWTSGFQYENATQNAGFNVNVKSADTNYLYTYGIRLIAGRNYADGDTVREVVVNEALLRKLNIQDPQQALGKTISLWGRVKAPIVGVVRDFHLYSLHEPNEPCFLAPIRRVYLNAGIRLQPQQMTQTLAKIEAIWKETYPDNVFSHQFLDEQIAQFYQTEDRMSKLVNAFSCLAIFIGCLGLYGLISFMTVQKTKEIGIRKVLGASVSQIVLLFTREFVKLVLIAFVLAAPLAWWAMSQWLQDFAFRIDLSAVPFMLAAGATLAIASLTVGYQSIRAALTNPVKALRSE